MANSSWINTSLDLNSNHFKLYNDDHRHDDGGTSSVKKISLVKERGVLTEELKRVSEENKKLAEMLKLVNENYNNLRDQVLDYMNKNNDNNNNNNNNVTLTETKEISPSRKRNFDRSTTSNNNNNNNNIGTSEISSTEDESNKRPKGDIIKAKITHVYSKTSQVSTETGLVVKDGYQWKKYGQKVTRDNPSPRAYFKCSHAPRCPVKKKVQRSIDDQSVLVATYEGEHDHPMPAQPTIASSSLCNITSTIDLTTTKSKSNNHVQLKPSKTSPEEPRDFLAQQMASSLTKDPNFTAALVAAISGKMFRT